MNQVRHHSVVASACVAAVLLVSSAVLLVSSAVPTSGVRAQGAARDFTISANQFKFSPVRIEVQKDDLVKISFTAGDIAHSFTIDQYRIAKRAAAGQTVVFEFRADQVGTHRFYCNLTQDDRCQRMEGQLVVR